MQQQENAMGLTINIGGLGIGIGRSLLRQVSSTKDTNAQWFGHTRKENPPVFVLLLPTDGTLLDMGLPHCD